MSTKDTKIPISDLSELPPPDDNRMFSMQVGEPADLPITEGPIRFAVCYRNGCTSNSWKVETRPQSGDAYIFCRDNMQAQHVSLHASGKRHVTLDPRAPSAGNLHEKQFLNQWQGSGDKTPTFRLVFPWWGVQLDAAQRNPFKSLWKKNRVFVEGHRQFLTILAFYVVSKQARLNKVGSLPGFVLAELPLKSGKKLAITAEWQPDRGIESAVRSALKQIPSPCEFSEEDHDNTYGLCMTGTIGSADSIYMVSFPAKYSNLRWNIVRCQ